MLRSTFLISIGNLTFVEKSLNSYYRTWLTKCLFPTWRRKSHTILHEKYFISIKAVGFVCISYYYRTTSLDKVNSALGVLKISHLYRSNISPNCRQIRSNSFCPFIRGCFFYLFKDSDCKPSGSLPLEGMKVFKFI